MAVVVGLRSYDHASRVPAVLLVHVSGRASDSVQSVKSLTWLVLTWRDENGVVGSSSRRKGLGNFVAKPPPFPFISSVGQCHKMRTTKIKQKRAEKRKPPSYTIPHAKHQHDSQRRTEHDTQRRPEPTYTTHSAHAKHHTIHHTHHAHTHTQQVSSAQCSEIQSRTSTGTQRD